MANTTMRFAGMFHSEETMWGPLPDGRHIYVEMLSVYMRAPKRLRDDPLYWLERLERGDFKDENPPYVWIGA